MTADGTARPARTTTTEASPPGSPPRQRSGVKQIEPEHLYKAVGLFLLVLIIHSEFDAISQVLLIVYAAAILGVAFNVVVGLLPSQRRWLSGLLGILIFGGIGVGLWLGLPVVGDQLRSLSNELPRYQQQLEQWTQRLRESTGLNIDLFGSQSREYLAGMFSNSQVLGTARGVLEGLFLPLVLIMGGLYAAAAPNDKLLTAVLRGVPEDRRDSFRHLLMLLGTRIKAWVKGTLLSMLIVGVLTSVGLYLIGVPYPLLLGSFAGIAEIIPLVGPWVAGAVVVGIAVLNDPTLAIWAAGLMLAIQQLESNVITPMVMASVADVHPFVTLFSLFLFATLFGFLGILLAVPLVLLIWTVLEVLWADRAVHSAHDRIEPVAKE